MSGNLLSSLASNFFIYGFYTPLHYSTHLYKSRANFSLNQCVWLSVQNECLFILRNNFLILEGEKTMKKFITLSLLFASVMFTAVFAEAAPKTNNDPQLWEGQQRQTRRVQQTRRINRRGVRIVTRTRIVRFGRQRYRETIQIRYLPNGRTNTRVISRVRIR